MAWPMHKTIKQVKSFVVLGSYFRRFIRNYAQIVRHKVKLTKKGLDLRHVIYHVMISRQHLQVQKLWVIQRMKGMNLF